MNGHDGRNGRRSLAAIIAMAMTCALAGCERHSASESYYLIANNTKLEYWQTASAGLQKAAAQYGVKAEMRGPDSFDPQGEVQEFRSVLARKPAGILVSVADPVLMGPEIDNALKQGVPVITMDSDAPNSHRLYFIGTNNLAAGRLGGQRVVQKLHGKGNVVFFSMPGQPNLDERLKGYQDAFKSSPGIQILEVYNIKGDSGSAMDKAQEYLGRKGDARVDAIICLEASAGKDVAQALQREKATDRLLVAMDEDKDTLNLVKSGQIDSTISQKPFTMAFYGLKALDEIHHYPVSSLMTNYEVDPSAPFPAFVDTGSALISKDNVDIFLQAQAPPK